MQGKELRVTLIGLKEGNRSNSSLLCVLKGYDPNGSPIPIYRESQS